ncbi:MAG: ABC transporter ATP-binding protein [Limnochordales bacterium]|nr:ABC transporter ATP-binding protein [Limnochordales bacterium]
MESAARSNTPLRAQRQAWRAYLRAIGVARRHWLRMILAFTGMMIDSMTILLVPLLLRWAIDVLTQHGAGVGGAPLAAGAAQLSAATWQLAKIALIAAGLALLRAGGIYLEIFMQESVGNWIARDIRSLLFQKMLRLPFAFFDRHQTGDIMSRLTKDVDAVRDGTGFVVLITVVNIVQVAGTITAMLLLDPTLTLVAMLIAPPIALITLAYTKAVSPLYREVEARSGTLHTVAQENISGIRVVKAFTRAPQEIEKFERENRALFKANLDIARLNSLVNPSLDLMGVLMSLVILGYGGYRVATGSMDLGVLMAFSSYAGFLYWPLRQTGWLADLISKALAGAVRIFELLDEREQPLGGKQDGAYGNSERVRGLLEFRDVYFAYTDEHTTDDAGDSRDRQPVHKEDDTSPDYALRGFNLVIRPGERVAIMGGTGSGKTTVANLIPRFYDPTAGQILLDGRDLREWPLEQLRRQIGFVFQDNFLFSLSIRDNICLGNPESDQARVQEVAEAAQIAATIERLPHGYETVVGERGIGLSGGERQRIALARALLLDPPILVLDDSTASLDAHTEKAVQAALDRLAAGRTVVIITSRVATAMRADRIVVMDKGSIVEAGTHAELLAQDGIYAQLYREQMSLRAGILGVDQVVGER